MIFVNGATTAFTITLPPAAGLIGKHYRLINISDTGVAVTIDGNSSETINGNLTILMEHEGEIWDIYSDGTNWYGSYTEQYLPISDFRIYNDDFMTGLSSQLWGDQGWRIIDTNGGSSAMIDTVSGELGIGQLTTDSGSADEIEAMFGSGTTVGNFWNNEKYTWTARVSLPSILSESVVIAGDTNINPPSHGVGRHAGFFFDPAVGNFWVCKSSNGTPETNVTALTVNVDTFYKLQVVHDGTDIKFYIDDVIMATHTEVPLERPTTFGISIVTNEAVAKVLQISFFNMRIWRSR